MSRPGPKTDLTPELATTIAGYVNAGATIPHASEAAGVKWDTCKRWIRKGRAGIEPYASFAAQIDQSRAMYRVAMQMVITGAAKRGDWRAAAYDLDRRSRAQKERDGKPDDLLEERVVLCYPVPVPPGARLSELQLAAGHAIDTTGEAVPPESPITVSYEDPDDD